MPPLTSAGKSRGKEEAVEKSESREQQCQLVGESSLVKLSVRKFQLLFTSRSHRLLAPSRKSENNFSNISKRKETASLFLVSSRRGRATPLRRSSFFKTTTLDDTRLRSLFLDAKSLFAKFYLSPRIEVIARQAMRLPFVIYPRVGSRDDRLRCLYTRET